MVQSRKKSLSRVIFVLLVLCLVTDRFQTVKGLGFIPGMEYWYNLEATTHTNDATTIYTRAKFGILPLNNSEVQTKHQQAPPQRCRLLVHDYHINIQDVGQSDQHIDDPEVFFKKRTLFDLSEDGEVQTIYYELSERPDVLRAKKNILGLVSSKLVFSRSQEEKGQRWGYGTNEIGHEGPHSAVYQAEPSGETVKFVKTKTTKAVANGKHTHVKKISLHKELRIPQSFHIEDEFATEEDSLLKGKGVDPAFAMQMPVMSSQSQTKVTLGQVIPTEDTLIDVMTSDLQRTTLKGDPEQLRHYNLSEAQEMIRLNLTCIAKHKDTKRSIPCFRVIRRVMERISFDNLKTIVSSYKNTKDWLAIVDVLGSVATDNTLYLLTTEVLMANTSKPEELMHAMVHLIRLESCPPKLLLGELMQRAFEEPWYFSDEHETLLVNDRAKLVVGALVSIVKKCNETWADDVTRRFESLLGVHDPWHHREMRSTMTQKEMRVHLSKKSVHMYALGNAGQMSSYNHLVSYLNTTESHMQLRFSAVEAVASYKHPEAAELLLQVALTDEEDNVRRCAIQAYQRHPQGGGDLAYFMDQQLYRYSNITTVEHKRMRRGVKEVISAIWKGFSFKLAAPGIDWQKIIGSKNAGASFGLSIKNEISLKVAPLDGYFTVDVHDAAFATIHLGIINFNFDIFRAEVCFNGKVEYNFNIFAEFGIDDITQLADIWNKYIVGTFKAIKNGIIKFKELIQTLKDRDINDIWNDFIDSVKALPQSVQSLRKDARNAQKALEEYGDLPPVHAKMRDFISKTSTMFNKIKTDVTTLYNAIIDPVEITIPWAWEEIKTAFNNMAAAFSNFFRDPKTALQNVGKAVLRIATAIGVIIQSKDKLVQANIFEKETRPDWLDFDQVKADMEKDSSDIKKAIETTISGLSGSPDEDDEEAQRYTGIHLKAMKIEALQEVWSAIEENILQGQMEHIFDTINPFLQIYKFFTETIQNVKAAWDYLVKAYETGKSIIEKVFGAKINKGFPRKYMVSMTCGRGFWKPTPHSKYKHMGVDLEVTLGTRLHSPFNGLIYSSGTPKRPQVTIEVSDLDNTTAIIDNVLLDTTRNNTMVGGGDYIGTVVSPGWCSDSHIHFSLMRSNTTGEYINPSELLEKRLFETPRWIEQCDHYKLVILGKTAGAGFLTKHPQMEDITPPVNNEPAASQAKVSNISSERSVGRRNIQTIVNVTVEKIQNLTESIRNVPGYDKLQAIFALNLNDVTLREALDFLVEAGFDELNDKIVTLLHKVETFVTQESCNNPNTMDDNELKAALALRGKETSGSRSSLVTSYLESDMECFGLQSHVSENIYCSYQTDCLGMSCCLDLNFFIYRQATSMFVKYDPCLEAVVLGLGGWTKTIHVSADTIAEDVDLVDSNVNGISLAQLQVYYRVKQEGSMLLVSLAVRWCSTTSEECQDLQKYLTDAQFDMPACDPSSTDSADSATDSSLSNLLESSVGEVMQTVEVSGIDEDEVNELNEFLREAFQEWLRQQIEDAIAQVFDDEFGLQDMCLRALTLTFGPYKMVFFKSPPISVQAGPVTIAFQMGVDGYFGASFSLDFCILSMKAVAHVTPRLGTAVWGSLKIGILLFSVELKITGYILTTAFPTTAEIGFSKFPLSVGARMDLELIPLRIELSVLINLEVPFIGISVVIFNKLIWSYQTPTIHRNIFNLNDVEKDESGPAFDFYTNAVCLNCNVSVSTSLSNGTSSGNSSLSSSGNSSNGSLSSSGNSSSGSLSTSRSRRGKRQVDNTPSCVVYQLSGRDYTDPAYALEIAVEDDKSKVRMTYCVGTFMGGCDVLSNKELGSAAIITEKMISGQPLYFKITATNNAGLSSYTTCEIATYDMTLPTGRVLPNFKTSSHPDILRASVLMTEDSEILETKILPPFEVVHGICAKENQMEITVNRFDMSFSQPKNVELTIIYSATEKRGFVFNRFAVDKPNFLKRIAVGYGDDRYGFQLVEWQDFITQDDVDTSYIGHLPLTRFNAAKEGKLPWKPFYRENHDEPEDCAQKCLAYPAVKCQGFNYDFDANGLCELLDIVEGEVELQRSSLFYYYERQGIGKVGEFEYHDLHLQHDRLLFFNVFIKNDLLYTNILSSEGILIDLTPPSPCINLHDPIMDELLIENCTAYTPSYLHQRCDPQTNIPNYRYITDGDNSQCVFNGNEPLVDHLYTRANRMLAANWDGFHDNETGILVYTWSVGEELCGMDVHPHIDPHAHLPHESEWTHTGVAFPLELEDGAYYVTVTALNKVEFGGPLGLTICHHQPYIIDNTPPEITDVSQPGYDTTTEVVTLSVNASDDLSLIKAGEFGLGRSPRDTYILNWQAIDNHSDLAYVYRVPDAIPVWVKIRVTNNVDLKTIDYSPRPIFVDLTAPFAGDIYHGDYRGYHSLYQSEDDTLCVVWEGFNDPDSGISEYLIALGTAPEMEDVKSYVTLDHTEASYCFTDLSLQHNDSYYVTMIAFNGATETRNVTGTSQGILVDLTPPVAGSVKDGLAGEPDTAYSSNAATIEASWQGFSDPESGLDTSQANILRTMKGSTEETTVHIEPLDPNTEFELELHHMYFYHGDAVRVSVSVTNGAGSSSEAASDGFTVDLTEPIMYSLVDGMNMEMDIKYTSSLTELTATWSFEDPESGIVHFQFTAYSRVGGRPTPIYPSDGTNKELANNVTTWTTDEELTLIPGGIYFIQISALNGAGLTAIHNTDGVIVDPSPPTMLYVHAGVLAGESEEVIDGFVSQNNPEGILGSWKAIDPESGIIDYKVSVGTSEGDDNIASAVSVGTSLDSFIGNLNLTLTDPDTNEPVYYISVVAVNGAGMSSASVSSSPVKMVEADRTGVVWDGLGVTIDDDEDYESGHYSVTLQFTGFASELNGIDHYLWALGSLPRTDDIKGFSKYGIVTDDITGRGLSDSGTFQEIIQLDQGVTYYATVRAITGAGDALDSSSDGFTVDSTSPDVSVSVLSPVGDENSTDVPVIFRESTAIQIQPGFLDAESGITNAWVSVGSYLGANDVMPSFEINDTSIVSLTARDDGQPTYFSVTAENHVGLTSSSFAPVIVIDNSEPTVGQLNCPTLISENDITCSWSEIYDSESSIDKYLFGIGTAEGFDNVIGFFDISKDDTSVTLANDWEFSLEHKVVYYATLTVINNVGKKSYVYSDVMTVDATPPSGGWVIELKDFVEVNAASGVVNTESEDVDQSMDVLCQRDITKVEVAWQEFTDEESGIDYYEVALGSTPGGTQVHDFVRIEGDSTRHTFYPVDLTDVRQVFVLVRGFNGVGLFGLAESNGVYISKHSSGLPPLSPLLTIDGNEGVDVDYQSDNDRLYAHWDLRGDPCPAVSLNWTVHKFDGTIAASTQSLLLETQYAEEDGITMHHGDSFFVELRVENALGFSYSIRSDGVTIELEPLIPGTVRDGTVIGLDLNFQSSTDTLSANWDGFGSDVDPETFSDYISGDSNSIDLGPHQEVHYYEVAIGTDRRYPDTRNNIRPFINVGLNKTWTFKYLELTPKTAYYYITVRAHSVSRTMVEVTSNGIRVGYSGSIASLGEISMNGYVTSLEEAFMSWTDFVFLVPVLHYYVAIKEGLTNIEDDLDCSDMIITEDSSIQISENFTSLFDTYPLTGVGVDTFVEIKNLSLEQAASYTAILVAVDEAGACAMIGQNFTVDITPPTEGRIGIGPDLDLAVLYAPSTEELTVWWEGYTDDESGLLEYDITLMLGSDCDNFDPRQMTAVVENQPLSPTSSNFTYLELTLMIGEPYYIILEVTNNGELTTQTMSRPIIVDIEGPTAGRVIDGTVYQHDLLFHGEPTLVEGRILYLPDQHAEECPYRRFPMTSKSDDWTHIVHRGMWTLPAGKQSNVVFLDKQLSYNDETGLTITMQEDITTDRLLSAGIFADADITEDAFYEFEIQAAGEMYGVTSVAVVDWNNGIMSDFYSTISGKEAEQVVSSETESPGYRVVAEKLDGDTYEEEYSMENQLSGNSFGFHIVKDTNEQFHVLLWAVNPNVSRLLDFPLDLDPTTDFHTYRLLVNDGENPFNEDDWSLKLLIDGELQGSLAGISAVGQSATVVIGLYNNHGLKDARDNSSSVFNVRKTTASFRNFRFSASSDELCRYGTPFIGGDHPIVEFYAGIGSEAGLDDVVQFKKVSSPCIPCQYPCGEKACNTTCDATAVQLIEISLDDIQLEAIEQIVVEASTPTPRVVEGITGVNPDGINLESIESVDPIVVENVILPSAYYLTVKGMTGSGKFALASSNGFSLDITPPLISVMYHVDLSWNEDEPSEYQGSNSTIAAYWRAIEDESEIDTFWWAIGTMPFGTDIQGFEDVGTDGFAQNTTLEGILENNKTYYITVKALNVAGLESINTTEGVTTMFEEPDLSSTEASVDDATRIGDPDSNAVETSSQEKFCVRWTDPSPTKVDRTYCAMGTAKGKDDIVPETPCGGGGAGSMTVDSEGIEMAGGNKSSLSGIKQSRKKRSIELLLEPGRSIYTTITGCTEGHKCIEIPTDVIMIRRVRDVMLQPDSKGIIPGHIVPNEDGGLQSIDILTMPGQSSGQYLIVGSLSASDLAQEFKSEGSSSFRSYVVDPEMTLQYTSRDLKGRIIKYITSGFYITGTPGQPLNSKMDIAVAYPSGIFNRSVAAGRPTLLTWCESEELWVIASESCSGEYLATVDWDNNAFTTPVCDIALLCHHSIGDSLKRRKRQSEPSDTGFSGPNMFLVAAIGDAIVNGPPSIITNTTYSLNEDVGTITFTIEAEDPDNDALEFLLDPDSRHNGEATLDPDGQASYKPCPDCFGADEVAFIVHEVRNDDVPALETTGIIRLDIIEINDNPVLVAIREGEALTGTVTMTVEQHQDSGYNERLRIALVSHDVDLDSITITMNGHEQGSLMLYGVSQINNITYPDCSADWDQRKKAWDVAVESILNPNGDLSLPVPCGLEGDIEGKYVNWVATAIEYTPNRDFSGTDTVQVVAFDEHDSVSEMLTINIFVLANPCENNATCIGPSWDTDCTDTGRVNGFADYTCGCLAGFTGSVCEVDIDECLSSPCPMNYSCVDQTNAYQCICQDGWPCSGEESEQRKTLDGWLIGVISAGVFLFVLLVMYAMFLVYKFCTASSGDGEKEPLFDNRGKNRNLKFPQHRENTRNRPMKIISEYRLKAQGGHVNRAYDDTGYFNKRSRSLERTPRSSGRPLREAPSRHRRLQRSYSDHTLSTVEYDRHLIGPVKRWVPTHIAGRGFYSSEYRAGRHQNDYQIISQRDTCNGLRRSHSVSEITPSFEVYS